MTNDTSASERTDAELADALNAMDSQCSFAAPWHRAALREAARRLRARAALPDNETLREQMDALRRLLATYDELYSWPTFQMAEDYAAVQGLSRETLPALLARAPQGAAPGRVVSFALPCEVGDEVCATQNGTDYVGEVRGIAAHIRGAGHEPWLEIEVAPYGHRRRRYIGPKDIRRLTAASAEEGE